MAFDGLRVLALESRRPAEIATLIRNQGGEPFVAPSMREVPLENNEDAFRFYRLLADGQFDLVILLTGVGTRALDRVIASQHGERKLADALKRVAVVARGPKPAAVLREWGVPVTVLVPEPNTWREVLASIEDRKARRIAVQEYGVTNERLVEGLRARGAEVTQVRVYQWDLPEDLGPLQEAVRRLAASNVDVTMFTTSVQIIHLLRVARDLNLEAETRRGIERSAIASIGPTTSETLEEFGFKPDVVPSHPKMGFLVRETAETARTILEAKRA
jgi:uroporphyrinogen-III synthase